MASSLIRSVISKNIYKIKLDNERKRNILSSQALRDLLNALRNTPKDCRVAVISSSHPVFSSGHDLRELYQNRNDPSKNRAVFDLLTNVIETIRQAPFPVIAAVDGLAAAAGCQLVAACDIAVASTRSTFSTPGVKFGLFCSTPAVEVARTVNHKTAMLMLCTGRDIDAGTAQRAGLVSNIVDHDQLWDCVDKICNDISVLSPQVIALGKKAFYAQCEKPNATEAYQIATSAMLENIALGDCVEGLAAFAEKRKPNW